MASLEVIAANPGKYSCSVTRLGECKIPSPVHHAEFVEDGE